MNRRCREDYLVHRFSSVRGFVQLGQIVHGRPCFQLVFGPMMIKLGCACQPHAYKLYLPPECAEEVKLNGAEPQARGVECGAGKGPPGGAHEELCLDVFSRRVSNFRIGIVYRLYHYTASREPFFIL